MIPLNGARNWLCSKGLHWPVRWDENAWPMNYDPPEPPESDFCCQQCGRVREPYRVWWWSVKKFYYGATGQL